jgi:SNF2 family DNA or RNA helicase
MDDGKLTTTFAESLLQESPNGLEILPTDLAQVAQIADLPVFGKFLELSVRNVPLQLRMPWTRTLGNLTAEVATQGWRFPMPLETMESGRTAQPEKASKPAPQEESAGVDHPRRPRTHLRPPSDLVMFKDRLLYLLQPALEDLFVGKQGQVHLPFRPYPYQIKGVAFLMPRHAALLADEMGLGKTAQVLLALRLLLHSGLIRRILIVCPKPLVVNWTRELRTWAEDVPFEVIGGDTQMRKAQWFASNCPVKLVNYELLTRDVEMFGEDKERLAATRSGARDRAPLRVAANLHFDVVVLDEAQRIKNRDAKTAQAVRSISRDRSWAMTGTPIENSVDDLINIFAFVDPERIPPETPPRLLPELTRDCILRRVKEEVAVDMPPKVVRDIYIELSASQRLSYDRAEKEGIVQLNALSEEISVQHVFELVLRLKQICNFDPATGESAKMDQLQADLAEVAECNRKAIVFSQWVEPLEILAQNLRSLGPLLLHGKVPMRDRTAILDRFKSDPGRHVLLMSYGTGSVGLNLQAANYVFLFDRWWNPAIEDQAINRAHRLGQKETVFVSRYVAQETIEGRIAAILERKRQLFKDMLETSGSDPNWEAGMARGGLTEEEIFGLFDVKARPRRAAAG